MPEEKIEDIFQEVEKSSKKQEEQTKVRQQNKIVLKKEESPIKFKQVNRNNPQKNKLFLKKFFKFAMIIIIVAVIIIVSWYAWDNLKQEKKQENIILNKETELQQDVEKKDKTTIEKKINDIDGDGLNDEEEIKAGTDKNKIDSDDDGLLDYEEVKIYLTDPLNKDSDGDGESDGHEVKNRKDPKNPDTNALLFNLQEEIKKLK